MNKEEFKDIAPYEDSEFRERMASLVKEPGFEKAVKFAMQDVDYPSFAKLLTSFDSTDAFQRAVMFPFLDGLAKKTSSGVTIDGLENCPKDVAFTFISNHRDIVLDATFLYLCMMRNGYGSGEIALGDNLLIFSWIEDIVKLNKGFIVKRNIAGRAALDAAIQLSNYIHYCITEKKESLWIAQREGRAKDSNDVTYDGVINMLTLADRKNIVEGLKTLNICPVSISYEYDPNDYLKATEFLQRHKNPEFVKCQHDDLLSMETGITGFKGRIHYHLCEPINDEIDRLGAEAEENGNKNHVKLGVCKAIDRKIHLGYMLFPSNYISYDLLNATDRFADTYSDEDLTKFNAYLDGQLNKVRLENVTAEDREFMRKMILTMYANPLINKFRAEGVEI